MYNIKCPFVHVIVERKENKMRKLFAVCLTLIMLFNAISLTAFAEEVPLEDQLLADGELTKAEIVELTALAFPEYEDKIRDNSIPANASILARAIDTVTFEETRSISDTTDVTYQELSSGATRSLVSYHRSITETSGSGYKDCTMTVWVQHSWSTQTFFVNNFKFRINTGVNVYDKITSIGTMSGDVISKLFNTVNYNETASSNATASWNATFAISFLDVESTHTAYLQISVGDDGYSISAS